MQGQPEIQAFLHPDTSTFSYLAWDTDTRKAAVVDPVLDYDPESGCTETSSLDEIVARARQERLTVEWILETHAHADHLTAARQAQASLGGHIAIGEGIRLVQKHFSAVYNLPTAGGAEFDHLFADEETFKVGNLEARVLNTPGHTPDHVSYLIGDALFVGDTLFMPDGGTARCDFPGGDAATLYRSIQRLFSLPEATRMFVLHDYQPGGREYRYETTVGEQQRENIHVGAGKSEAEFVAMRDSRDQTLGLPRLIIPSVQVNMRGGQMPPAEANATSYLKIPLDRRGSFSRF